MHRIQRSNGDCLTGRLVQMTNRNSGIAGAPSVLCVGLPISHVVSAAALLHLHCCCIRSRLGISEMTRSSLMRLQRLVAAGNNARQHHGHVALGNFLDLMCQIFRESIGDCKGRSYTVCPLPQQSSAQATSFGVDSRLDKPT